MGCLADRKTPVTRPIWALGDVVEGPKGGGRLPPPSLRLLNALNSEDRGLKVGFSLAMIVFETFELILCQMLSSQGKKRTFKPLSSLFSAFSNLKVLGRLELTEALLKRSLFGQAMSCCAATVPI